MSRTRYLWVLGAGFVVSERAAAADGAATLAAVISLETILAAVITGLLGAVLTWFAVTGHFSRTVKKVIAGMERIAKGDLDYRLTVSGRDQFTAVAETFNDMASKLELLLHRLREVRTRLEGIVESSGDIIVTVDRSGRIRTFNRGAEIALGYDRNEAVGRRIETLFADPDVEDEVVARLKKSGQLVNYEAKFLTKDGDERIVISSIARLRNPHGFTIGTIAIGKDVTRERSLQQQLIQSERYVAIGQSFAALQHSMKNMLNALPGGAYMVEKGIEKNDWDIVKDGWEIVAKGTTSIRDLSKSLLRYVKDWDPEFASVPVEEIIAKIDDVFAPTAVDHGLAFSTQAAPDLPLVRCDASLIHSAVMDMLSNASEACLSMEYEAGQGPEITITAEHAPAAQAVAIEVRDNGPGMTEKIMSQIFTPFFSTKKQKGTGLGLALTSRIVSLHGAKIEVESEPGRGALFRILLPVADADQT
jgi:PAS domain S-box-containing protein